MYILYKTVNLLDGNFYVGKHKQRKGHDENSFDGYLGSGTRLKNAIKKHGRENFTRETLDFATTEAEINQKEFDYITDEMIDDPACYNIGKGGQGGAIWSKEYYKKHCENFKINNPIFAIKNDPVKYAAWYKKTLLANQTRKPSKLQREKNLKYLYSDRHPNKKPNSPETRKKISEALKGRSRPKGKDSPNFGKKYNLSEATKLKKKLAMQQARMNEIHYCKECDRTIKTNGNWAKHLKSKLHAVAVKKYHDSHHSL